MGKASHYVGLYGWSSFKFSKNDIVFCDSISLYFMARAFGFKLRYLPGSKSLKNLDQNSSENIYLTPFFLNQFPEDLQFTLPMLSDVKAIPETIIDWLNSKSGVKKIYIGISSPKQNALGSLLAEKYDASIQCVGAAIIDAGTNDFALISKYSGSGLEWLVRGLKLPKRFFSKSSHIFIQILKILLIKKTRKKFRTFLSKIDENNSIK
ncbi:MAG: hypothetical protein ACJ0HI_00710 [Gammaproteobacteria bacterium]